MASPSNLQDMVNSRTGVIAGFVKSSATRNNVKIECVLVVGCV